MMFHGITLYASYGRNVGTFGGRAKSPSLKIYDTRDCGRALQEIACIPNNDLVAHLRSLKDNRDAMQSYLSELIE